MDKILLYERPDNGQQIAWDISTDELRDRAYLEFFGLMNREFPDIYMNLDPAERQMHEMARRGNARFAQAFMMIRQRGSGEQFREITLGLPIPTDRVRPVIQVDSRAVLEAPVPESTL
jgi:hypothetical protein